MLQGTIIRGTTPKHDFGLPYPIELIKDIRLAYVQNKKVVFVKQKNECTRQDGTLSIVLTQEETLSFAPNKIVGIEIRIKLYDGQVVRNEEPVCLRVVNTYDEEVMK